MGQQLYGVVVIVVVEVVVVAAVVHMPQWATNSPVMAA